jgi:hypothetical protein
LQKKTILQNSDRKEAILQKLKQRRFTPNFVGLTSAPRGNWSPICKKSDNLCYDRKKVIAKMRFCEITIFVKNSNNGT